MKNKEKFLFWFFLSILLISRIIEIIDTRISIRDEESNLFISSSIADGVIPSPIFFQVNIPQVGGGHLVYDIVATPFILLFGKSFFSLRLASIIFLILTYLVTYRFCNRYLGLETAAFVSFLFVITPGLLATCSIRGEGRYFHLNLFFISSLYCLSEIKATKRPIYYLLLGMACGLGVYFYPAFLVTVFVLALFLLSETDMKKPSLICGYLTVIACVVLAGNFLEFGSPWYHSFYKILFGMERKNIIIQGGILQILNRSAALFLKVIPNTFAFSRRYYLEALFSRPFKEYFCNLTTISGLPLEVFRLIFIISCVSLCWINWRGLKEIVPNVFSTAKKKAIPTRSYITIFLLGHLFIYICLYSFNKNSMSYTPYFMPLFLNIILIIAIFLSHIWQRNKALSILLLVSALSPGVVHQYHNFTEASTEDFYKHYIYFWRERTVYEQIWFKPISVHRLMCARLNINVCHTLGFYYASKSPDEVQKDFEYISDGDIKKLGYLYQGYIFKKVMGSRDKIESFSSVIEKIDKKYQKFCYIGFGEGLFTSTCLDGDRFAFGKYKEIVEGYRLFVEGPYRRYFFQGTGEGLAKLFATPYSRYITDTGLFDYGILENCLKIIDDRGCRKSFLTGFCNKDIWTPY